MGMYPVLKHPRFAVELRAGYIPIHLSRIVYCHLNFCSLGGMVACLN